MTLCIKVFRRHDKNKKTSRRPREKAGDAATGVAHGPVVVDEGGVYMKWGYHVVNIYGIAKRKKEQVDTTGSDAWATRRQRELAALGVQAKVVRRRKREPLCVCYNLNDLKLADAEALLNV